MKFLRTEFEDLFILESDKKHDMRGFFSRVFDKNEFKRNGIESNFLQLNFSYNKKRGTLRGMHYQKKPYEEVRIIHCTKGKIFDVSIDLRPKSQTYLKWFGMELSELDHKMMYIPKGFAHGFQTLKNDTEVFYQISTEYKPDYSMGVKWNDEVFKIKWPLKPTIISKKDRMFKSL